MKTMDEMSKRIEIAVGKAYDWKRVHVVPNLTEIFLDMPFLT